jgi:hypothetical protein
MERVLKELKEKMQSISDPADVSQDYLDGLDKGIVECVDIIELKIKEIEDAKRRESKENE